MTQFCLAAISRTVEGTGISFFAASKRRLRKIIVLAKNPTLTQKPVNISDFIPLGNIGREVIQSYVIGSIPENFTKNRKKFVDVHN